MSTIFITGATSGLGLAFAMRFINDGWNVIIAGRRQDKLDTIVSVCPERVFPLTLDVRDKEKVYGSIASLPENFKQIDVLVNNAGLFLGTERAQNCNIEDWEVVVDTNIKGLLYCTKAILPGMISRNKGHIVNIGSIAGSYAYTGSNIYGSTKAFIEQFSRNLRCDLFGTNLRVTNLEPGIVKTDFTLIRTKGDKRLSEAQYANCTPLTAEDMAECVSWAVNLPAHVDVTRIEVWPICQNIGELQIMRTMPGENRPQLGTLTIHK